MKDVEIFRVPNIDSIRRFLPCSSHDKDSQIHESGIARQPAHHRMNLHSNVSGSSQALYRIDDLNPYLFNNRGTRYSETPRGIASSPLPIFLPFVVVSSPFQLVKLVLVLIFKMSSKTVYYTIFCSLHCPVSH